LRRVDADQQVGRGGCRRHGLGDLGNFRDHVARHDEHRVADIHDDGIGFLGEDGAGDGVIALELDRVGGREIRGAKGQRQQHKLFLQ
jgi:hypothetical protein